MDICIFYSWQSEYEDNCKKIIGKALDKAVSELNKEQKDYSYYVKRGGGDVVGEIDITEAIDRAIKYEADIALVDFTHNGILPKCESETGEWKKQKWMPNPNATNEHGKLVMALGEKQVFKVYNTAYGEVDVNLIPPFDWRQKHYPVPFCCYDNNTEQERTEIIKELTKSIKARIEECTEAFVVNQKERFSPLIPMRNEYSKKMYQSEFITSDAYRRIKNKIDARDSFRLLALPGLGKTRMVGESFRGRDNDVYYCDCREQHSTSVIQALDKLIQRSRNCKPTVILDNCDQKFYGFVNDSVNDYGYNCQIISIHYNPGENVDTGVEYISLKVEDFSGVVEDMVERETRLPKETREAIVRLSGGFPLMASLMIENCQNDTPLATISKKDVFERMLGLDPQNEADNNKLQALTAFSIFKFIGLYGPQEKQGRFIAGNRIILNIRGTEEDNFLFLKEQHNIYQKIEILERQGNLVLMRLIPLAIYLCRTWFDKQNTESIAELINQITHCPDEGIRNMLIESLSQRITLLSDVPLAEELNKGLTNPYTSPFLTEEVVLSALGSRLFLAFSEVNPESCAIALRRMIEKKSDQEIRELEPARRNLAWALDHLAFDKRSFKNAMMTLARFSLVETEEYLANNTTGLFIDRFAILLSGTEANLSARIEVLKDLASNENYNSLIKKSLLAALHTGDFHRSGGAEKQGTRTLIDYHPSLKEVKSYYNDSLDLFLSLADNGQDIEDVARTLANNARGYYSYGATDFLLRGLEIIAPKKNFVWEGMKDALSYMLYYDMKKRNSEYKAEVEEWKAKLTKDDYVYTLSHLGKEIERSLKYSVEEEAKQTQKGCEEKAKELVDKGLYGDLPIMTDILKENCFYYNIYGTELSSYAKEKGVQKDVLEVLLNIILHNNDVSAAGETLLLYFLLNVEDSVMLEQVYESILSSDKKRLLPAVYAIKTEGADRLASLFDLLDRGELELKDFAGYFYYRTLKDFDIKYVAGRLLDYGAEGAEVVLASCHNLLFGEKELDTDYLKIGRRCLLSVDLEAILQHDYAYMQSVGGYLAKHRDDELALHIQDIQEQSLTEPNSRDSYCLERLYRKVLNSYTELLKPRIFNLLDNPEERHSWIGCLQTSYPQETGCECPAYTLIPMEEWFGWIADGKQNERAYTLAMMLSYTDGYGARPEYVDLLNRYWCDELRGAISSRFHSFSWSGSGIPLYQSRIAICKDYSSKLTNSEAKEWFEKDISCWEKEIEQERLQNAHERAIYN